MKSAILAYFDTETSVYFYKGIDMLIKRSEKKRIEIKEDYIEK